MEVKSTFMSSFNSETYSPVRIVSSSVSPFSLLKFLLNEFNT